MNLVTILSPGLQMVRGARLQTDGAQRCSVELDEIESGQGTAWELKQLAADRKPPEIDPEEAEAINDGGDLSLRPHIVA